MGEKGLYFFEYAGYGGECYIVRADSEAEAVVKLKARLLLEPPVSVFDSPLCLDGSYLLEFVDDVAKTLYLGE